MCVCVEEVSYSYVVSQAIFFWISVYVLFRCALGVHVRLHRDQHRTRGVSKIIPAADIKSKEAWHELQQREVVIKRVNSCTEQNTTKLRTQKLHTVSIAFCLSVSFSNSVCFCYFFLFGFQN